MRERAGLHEYGDVPGLRVLLLAQGHSGCLRRLGHYTYPICTPAVDMAPQVGATKRCLLRHGLRVPLRVLCRLDLARIRTERARATTSDQIRQNLRTSRLISLQLSRVNVLMHHIDTNEQAHQMLVSAMRRCSWLNSCTASFVCILARIHDRYGPQDSAVFTEYAPHLQWHRDVARNASQCHQQQLWYMLIKQTSSHIHRIATLNLALQHVRTHVGLSER